MAAETMIDAAMEVKSELIKLKRLASSLESRDASRRQLEDEVVKLWLRNLEDVAYEADNLLDEFNYEIIHRKVEIGDQMKRKVRVFFSSANPLLFRSRMAHKIKDVNMKLKRLNEEAISYDLQRRVTDSAIFVPHVTETDSISVDPVLLGRENDTSNIVNLLVNPRDEVVSIFPIVGMGGIGKTTLARLVFNNQQVMKHFDEKIWVCVSENFASTTRLFKRILESLTNDVVQVESREAILKSLKEKLRNRRYLLVLDDLWNEEQKYWEEFRSSLLGINSNKGNFVMVTTRSENVVSIMNPKDKCLLNKLTDDDCWKIIKNRAFSTGEEVSEDMETIGRNIANRCGGLPLAANMIGGSLQGKGINDWTTVLGTGISDSNGDVGGVLEVLKVSFDRLPSALLKKCFAYCFIFPKNAIIDKERLIQLWLAEGFLVENDGNDMESLGSRVYDILLQHSFFQEAVKDKYGNVMHSKMHDLVHDMACLISKAGSFNMGNFVADNIPPTVIDQESHKLAKEDAVYLHLIIRVFPEAICKLYNLQILITFGCMNLKEFPGQLHKLVSLRHLIIRWYPGFQMPLQIGKLTCLRTLKFFYVGHENGCRIDELRFLKNLKGELDIHNLEYVNDKEEASRARLIESHNIHKLELVWSRSRKGKNSNDEQVVEGLHPPPNIKSLTISGFHGHNFPSWIMDRTIGTILMLDKLIELKLTDCERCIEVPTLDRPSTTT
ncbi:putative disease resistance protein RGA4 [Sesamum alatum]|uniref:Disease resistance protein RGA4 n=1 Tax=Sesamum alatum TaxID=300844 RepID=A0AAE1Y8Z0_9LAMI|nr:putative disease resistance protein RGA4 [Sesamum alatum]